MGRHKTTGRFDTREELVRRVRHLMLHSELSDERIGKSVGVSQGTVSRIYETKEGRGMGEIYDY